MKTTIRILSLLLSLLILAAPLVACTTQGNDDETQSEGSSDNLTDESEGKGSDGTEDSESEDSESEESGGQDTDTDAPPTIENEYTDLIQLSNGLKNGVNPYYTDATRAEVTIDNQVMSLGYGMVGMSDKMQISHLSNTKGVPYISNTMDVVLNMKNGKSYCGSRSLDSSILNIYRYGFYYYETRI